VINASERLKAIDIGEKYLEREARRLGVSLSRVSKGDFERVASEYGVSKMEDLHAALGFGKYSARQMLHKLAPDQVPELPPTEEGEKPPPRTSHDDYVEAARDGRPADAGDLVIKVKGVDDLMVYRAKCCNPIRGEPIVGYVTRGKGVAVHSKNCPNVTSLMYEVERQIDVEWARSTNEAFPVKMVVYTDDRPGMLNELTSILFHESSNIRSLEARGDDKRNGDGAIVEMTVEMKDKRQLEKVSSAIRRIPGVRDVERVQ